MSTSVTFQLRSASRAFPTQFSTAPRTLYKAFVLRSASAIKLTTLRFHSTSSTMAPQFTIPKTQKAAIVEQTDAPLKVVDNHPVKQPEQLQPGECLVELDCSGVCHTDLHARNGDWPIQPKLPLIGGHEVRLRLCRTLPQY